MGSLEGAVSVVTGAGRGMGRTIAEELGFAGARVVVNYSRSKEPAEEVVERLSGNGAEHAAAIGADVSKPDEASRLIEDDVVPEEVKERIRKRIPLGRIGKPREVVRAVRFLVEDGYYITGQTININGGIYMQ